MARPIHEIAREIARDWSGKGKGIGYAARPYLDAMLALDSIDDYYGADRAAMIIAYFLGNARGYRGEKAKALKAELNAMLKG